ncbi:PQQ-dependent sugar dehydrogenase [Actinocatenispora rupis]|uniref:Oxidoreductase n=1 Tax=Actinocatenispora rupis TaxID=519421 RepID=A0A8J3J291_9ACTN|nr:oxidoreductase [Actinocatenispora rupis]
MVTPVAPRRRVLAAATTGLLALVAAAGCAFGPPDDSQQGTPPKLPSPSTSPSSDDGGATVQVIAKKLAVPWGIAFLPDGTALVTQRDKRTIVRLGANGGTPKTVQTVSQASAGGEGGLLGIAVSPKYAKDKTIFVYYSTKSDNRIASLTLGGTPKPIVTGIPHSSVHNGGALAFGPDGYLYAGTGDGSSTRTAQDKSSLGGKILRMTTAGRPAPGNPFGDSLVYSYGHRNVQGLAWDTGKRLYATEFGQDRYDEINVIRAGRNYGWPDVEGTGKDSRYTNPLLTLKPAEASCSGIGVSGPILVTACLRGQRIWLAQLDGKGGLLGAPQHTLDSKYGRLRAVAAAPDGTLWVSTSNRDGRGTPIADDDRILRLVISGGNRVDKS